MESQLKEFDFTKDEIKLNNSIVEKAIGRLNKNSFELFMFICSDFSKENLIETPDLFKLTIKNKDFLESIGFMSDYGYSEIKKYFRELQQTIFDIPLWDNGKLSGEVITGLITKSIVYKKGTTTIWITKELAPYYYTLKIERDRTITNYNLMKSFNSEFSAKIYFMLIRWKNTNHKNVTYEVEELKIKLGKKNKYKDFKEFNRCVIEVAKKEINEKTDILMDYRKLALGKSTGQGRKPITHIEFSFKIKNEQQEELLTEKQIIELFEFAEKRTIGTTRTAKEFYDYAFALTLEGCNNKGFYKYIKKVLRDDKIFLGQVFMFTDPNVRAATKRKSDGIHKQLINESFEM